MSLSAVGPFEAQYRVRFDEAGPDGLARPSILLRMAQDVAWRHSGHLGFDRAWYVARGLAWLVRTVDLEVRQAIPAGTEMLVDTTVTDHGRITARRRSAVWRRGVPEPAATAVTGWVLIDGRGRPTRLPPEFAALLGPPSGNAEPGRVTIGPAPETATRLGWPVRRSEIDPNGHVNNAVYLDWIDEVLRFADGRVPGAGNVTAGRSGIERLPRRYRVEYLAPLAVDEAVELSAWRDPGGWSIEVSAGAGRRAAARGQVVLGRRPFEKPSANEL